MALLCDLEHCWLEEQEGGKCGKWNHLTQQYELIQGEFKNWTSISTHSTAMCILQFLNGRTRQRRMVPSIRIRNHSFLLSLPKMSNDFGCSFGALKRFWTAQYQRLSYRNSNQTYSLIAFENVDQIFFHFFLFIIIIFVTKILFKTGWFSYTKSKKVGSSVFFFLIFDVLKRSATKQEERKISLLLLSDWHFFARLCSLKLAKTWAP